MTRSNPNRRKVKLNRRKKYKKQQQKLINQAMSVGVVYVCVACKHPCDKNGNHITPQYMAGKKRHNYKVEELVGKGCEAEARKIYEKELKDKKLNKEESKDGR